MPRMVGSNTSGRVRQLTKAEIESYDHLPPELASRVWLIDVGYLPSRFQGMTLGRFILLADMAPPTGKDLLLAHELVHVRQWTELGVIGFGYRYLRDFFVGLGRHRRWRRAYRDIEAEREARRESETWARNRPGRMKPPPGRPGDFGV